MTSSDTTSPTDTDPPASKQRRGRRRVAAPVKPAGKARVAVSDRAEAKRRNPLWLAGGLLLVVLCALGGALLFTSTDERVQVLVAASDLQPGTPVTRDQLQFAEIVPDGGQTSVMGGDHVDAIVGRQPTGLIPMGSVLSEGMFQDDLPLGPGEMVIGAALEPGQAPASQIDLGVPVELIVTSDSGPLGSAAGQDGGSADGGSDPVDQTEADQAADGEAENDTGGGDVGDQTGDAPGSHGGATVIGRGTVWDTQELGTDNIWLSIKVPEDVGLVASQASADGTLRVVLRGAGR